MDWNVSGTRVAGIFFGLVLATGATAQDVMPTQSPIEPTVSSQAAVTFGPYVRAELRLAAPSLDDAYWLPPGFPGDPKVNFDLDGDNVGFGALALGYDWMNGFRADLSLSRTGDIGFAGPCSSASDGSPCAIHADITDGSVRSTALMGNLFYSPLEARGSNATFQPYIVGGIGFSRNTMDSWTRFNPLAGTPTRTFDSNSETEFAWSLGVGASWQLTQPGERPVLLDVSWRYYDFGDAVGGSVGTPGGGGGGAGGVPVQPLTFDLTSHVVSIGIRIPLQRY
jgi:opacity protein-like surface antigen